MNVSAILDDNVAAVRADKIALYQGEETWTYGALAA